MLVRRASLEDVFLILTGRTLEELRQASRWPTPPVLRVVERECAWSTARLWRGAVFSTFLSPVLFLAAMGLGLGGLVDEQPGTVDGADVPRLRRARAAGRERDAVAAGESLWPVLGGHEVDALLPRHGRDADPAARRRSAAS